MRRAFPAIALLILVATGCPSNEAPDPEHLSHARAEGVIVDYSPDEVTAEAAAVAAQRFAEVRTAVLQELGFDAAPVESGGMARQKPLAEVVLYEASAWGPDRLLVTHADIVDEPELRVRIPCPLHVEHPSGDTIANLFRPVVAHEVTESTVLANVRIIDPYLRWMHDGIAESVMLRVMRHVEPETAVATAASYSLIVREAERRDLHWVDLARWRQLSDWLVHSDALFRNHAPLRIDDVQSSLDRLARERVVSQALDPVVLARYDSLTDLLSETMEKEKMPAASGEADCREKGNQLLLYGASMCFWLELETAHPGLTARVVEGMRARAHTVLTWRDVAALIEELADEPIWPRVERYDLSRMELVLQAELNGPR